MESVDAGRDTVKWDQTPFQVVVGEYSLLVLPDGRPGLYHRYVQQARLAENIGPHVASLRTAFVAVRHSRDDWPFLVVTQGYAAHVVATDCGAVLLPETRRLFLAAGESLLAYDITPDQPRRLWEDTADTGFWNWRVHEGVVLMAAELELAAWDSHATKLWSTFVEPPWSYRIDNETIVLEVMGKSSRFALRGGPSPLEHAGVG